MAGLHVNQLVGASVPESPLGMKLRRIPHLTMAGTGTTSDVTEPPLMPLLRSLRITGWNYILLWGKAISSR
jgi:hypothetical protein